MYFAGPDSTANSEWLFDSGATNHVTADPSMMNQKTEYNGSEKLIIGNGQGLCISNIGSSHYNFSNGNISLNKILHVPQITKNLLSIARITSDNNAIVEFISHCVFVKDKDSKRVLLRGVLKDGLYKVLIPHVFSNFSGVANNSSMALFNSVSNQFNCFSSSVSVNKL